MEYLVSALLGADVQPASKGRRIRLLDGTSVPKAGKEAKNNNGLWRLHCVFDLPAQRFSFIKLTDEKGGARLDRVSYAKGDIAIADRGYMHPDPLAHILEQGADVIVRTPWKGARWLGKDGEPFDLLAALTAAQRAGLLDTPIWMGRKKGFAVGSSDCCVSPDATCSNRPDAIQDKHGSGMVPAGRKRRGKRSPDQCELDL